MTSASKACMVIFTVNCRWLMTVMYEFFWRLESGCLDVSRLIFKVLVSVLMSLVRGSRLTTSLVQWLLKCLLKSCVSVTVSNAAELFADQPRSSLCDQTERSHCDSQSSHVVQHIRFRSLFRLPSGNVGQQRAAQADERRRQGFDVCAAAAFVLLFSHQWIK